MEIPSEINSLLDRLAQELSEIEQTAQYSLQLVKIKLERFPEYPLLVQLFGILNNHLLFVEVTRRRIAYDSMILRLEEITTEQIQTAGEDLSELLGRVIESKIAVNLVKNRFEDWS